MEFLYTFYKSILKNDLPLLTNKTDTIISTLYYYGSFTYVYFFSRGLLTNVFKNIQNNENIQNIQLKKETISRICSSFSQIYIIIELYRFGPERSIHAFLAYLINDIVFSFVFSEPLQKMIYFHHFVSILISLTGLKIFLSNYNNLEYKNCYVISTSLLGMEISAPLLSLDWILTKEKCLEKIKPIARLVLWPFLYFFYIVFRLLVPQYLFFYLICSPWNTNTAKYENWIFYSIVFSCIFALINMQIYWISKLILKL